jgi:hypothetical protein
VKRLSQVPIRQWFSVTPGMLNERSEVSDRVAVNQNGVASGDTGKDDDVTAETTPDQRLAGNAKRLREFTMALLELAAVDPDGLRDLATELLTESHGSGVPNEST